MPSVPRDENGSSDHLSRHLGKRAVGPGIHEGQGRRRGRRAAGSCCFSFSDASKLNQHKAVLQNCPAVTTGASSQPPMSHPR